MPDHVFISYSRKDKTFVERLCDDLRNAHVPFWIDEEGIPFGAPNWEHEIRNAIDAAKSVLWIVSPDSVVSPYVRAELTIAHLKERPIYPVFAAGDPKKWGEYAPFELIMTQFIDARGDAYVSNLSTIIKTLHETSSPLALRPKEAVPLAKGVAPRNPYKGLNAFKETDADDFFGRETLTKSLLESLAARQSKGEPRFLAVVGASGGGKSSVVMAGLLPKLRASSMKILRIVPGKRPLENLATIVESELGIPHDVVDDLLKSDGRGLHRMLRKNERVLLFVDQFEEVFTLTETEDERAQFINLLTTAATEADGSLTLLLTMRADYFDRPLNYPMLSDQFEKYTTLIKPLSLTELVDAIEKPAVSAGLTFESGLVAEMVFQLRDKTEALSGALPLLQFTLERLYELRAGTTLTRRAYDDIGGVQGAIGNHADAVFAGLDAETQTALPHVAAKVVSIDETSITRRRAPLSEFENHEPSKRLLNVLINARLLAVNQGDVPYVEATHEALFTTWKQFASMIEANREGLRQLRRLQVDAQEWERKGKPKRYPYWLHGQLKPIYTLCEKLNISFDPLTAEFARPEVERLIEEYRVASTSRRLFIIEQWIEIGKDAVFPLTLILKDNAIDLRLAAAQTLGQIGDVAAVTTLIGALNDTDKDVRYAVVRALGQLKNVEAVIPLIEALNDVDENISSAVAEALGQIKDVSAVAPLITTFNYGGGVITAAIKALAEIGDSAVMPLLVALKSENTKVRYFAEETLRKMGGKVVEPLIEALLDTDNNIRQAAAVELAKIKSLRAVTPLLNMLNDEDEDVRFEVIRALGKIKDDKAVDPLIIVLKDKDPTMRYLAASALGQIGDKRSITPLLVALEDEHEYVRQFAAYALGDIGDSAAVDPLIALLQDGNWMVRHASIFSLAKLGDKVPVEPLITLLQDENSTIRTSIVNVLGDLGGKVVVTPLIVALQDKDISVQRQAIKALGNVGDEAAIESLIIALKEKDREIPRLAADALTRIGGPKALRAVWKWQKGNRYK